MDWMFVSHSDSYAEASTPQCDGILEMELLGGNQDLHNLI